jgi:hypothetical protein
LYQVIQALGLLEALFDFEWPRVAPDYYRFIAAVAMRRYKIESLLVIFKRKISLFTLMFHRERWKKVVLQRTKVALNTRHSLQYFWLLIHPLRAEDEVVLAVLKGKQHSAESQERNGVCYRFTI